MKAIVEAVWSSIQNISVRSVLEDRMKRGNILRLHARKPRGGQDTSARRGNGGADDSLAALPLGKASSGVTAYGDTGSVSTPALDKFLESP